MGRREEGRGDRPVRPKRLGTQMGWKEEREGWASLPLLISLSRKTTTREKERKRKNIKKPRNRKKRNVH